MVKSKIVEETGTVTAVNGVLAKVAVPKKAACEGCSLGICSQGEEKMIIEARNQAGAAVGQRVRVVIQSPGHVKAALIVYGIPTSALMVAALLANRLDIPGVDPEALPAIAGIAAFIASFVGIKFWSGRRRYAGPVVDAVLEERTVT